MGGIFAEESGSDEHFELFMAIELKDIANAVQNLAAHATVARFEPAQRAAIDIRQVSDLLLGQPALVSEPDQHAS
jgi:hypothetical protein